MRDLLGLPAAIRRDRERDLKGLPSAIRREREREQWLDGIGIPQFEMEGCVQMYVLDNSYFAAALFIVSSNRIDLLPVTRENQ